MTYGRDLEQLLDELDLERESTPERPQCHSPETSSSSRLDRSGAPSTDDGIHPDKRLAAATVVLCFLGIALLAATALLWACVKHERWWPW